MCDGFSMRTRCLMPGVQFRRDVHQTLTFARALAYVDVDPPAEFPAAGKRIADHPGGVRCMSEPNVVNSDRVSVTDS